MTSKKFQFQDGSILPVKGTFKSMVDYLLHQQEWNIDAVAKLLNQSGTVLDVATQPFKVLKSPHRTLLVELYRDRMLAIGWNYPPRHRFDNFNRSCWATKINVSPLVVRSDSIAYWLIFWRGLKDAGYEEENLTVEKIEECIGLARRLEQGEKVLLYGEQVTRRTLAPDVRRSSDMLEVMFVLDVELYLRECACRFFRIHGSNYMARVNNMIVLGAMDSALPRGIMDVHERMSCAGSCTTVSDFLATMVRDMRWDPVETLTIDGLSCRLQPFQAETLAWMLERERSTLDLFFPLRGEDGQVVSYYSPLMNLFRAEPFVLSRGGFLCSEFGMGKTIMCLALILKHRGTLPTLVVTSTTLCQQWVNEVGKSTLRCAMYHGARRDAINFEENDVVVTTYGILRSSRSTLLEQGWHRVILDESHTIKNCMSATASAVYALQAKMKWCVSATPIQTKIDDFYGQLKWFSASWTRSMWAALIRTREPFQRGNRLAYLVRRMSYANLRDQKYGNGDPIVELPSLFRHRWNLFLPAEEREEYDGLRIRNAHSASMGELMARCEQYRRFCSNGTTRQSSRRPPSSTTLVVDSVARVVADRQCPICLCPPDEPVMTRCKHVFCRECSAQLFQHASRFDRTSRCPLCRRQMVESDLRVLAEEESEETGPAAAPVQRKVSIKLLSVFDRIERIKEARPTARVVVFSQYVGTLSRLIEMCPHETCHIDGSTPQRRRAKQLERFSSVPGSVLFMSMRSGACGINLHCATDVILVEPSLNEGLEDQAIGRVHRMGQRQEGDVYVHHLVLLGTIEERIMRARGVLSSTAGRLGRNTLVQLLS